MKSIQLITLIGVLLTLNSCQTNLDDIMSANDIAALGAMETSYIAAVDANTALANYIESSGITNDQTCFAFDHAYHENDSIFGANHNMYSHRNSGDNHDSNSWIMGSGWMNGNGGMNNSGGMMGNGFNANTCDSYNLNLMDSLMNVHDDYHPGN